MSDQFPPSSPFLDHQQHDDPFSSITIPDKKSPAKLVLNMPFNKKQLGSQAKTYDYPTPNPSSSAGLVRSSSPVRTTHFERETTPTAVNPSSTNEIISEDQVSYTIPNALKVKINSDKKVTLGRSSKCDYFIRSKFASRIHLKLHYDSQYNELTILCKGHNGVVINFGTSYYGHVREIGENSYKFETINKKDVKHPSEEILRELSLFKDEQVIVPYNENLTLNVKDHVTALEIVYDESETEDELFELKSHNFSSPQAKSVVEENLSIKSDVDVNSSPLKNNKNSSEVVQSTMKQQNKNIDTIRKPLVEEVNKAEDKKEESVEPATEVDSLKEEMLIEAKGDISPVFSNAIEASVSTYMALEPTTSTESISATTTIQSTVKSKEASTSNAEPIYEKHIILPSSQPRTPLQKTDKNTLNIQSNSDHHQQKSRRRKADPGLSPQKKKVDSHINRNSGTLVSKIEPHTTTETIKRKYINPREKISSLKIEEILSTIEELESIKNVLINHLAFSRLSQTPLKQLQTVSVLTQNITRQQLRATLASIRCIGVIYRHGKDAAGKPLDEEYYYDAENDDDAERTQLVSSIKGSSGLRNCRKTHKQYFWKKPVTKK